MTQEEVYRILEELGGSATTKEVSRKAKEKFPNCSLWSYVGYTLRKLEKKGYVAKTQVEDSREVRWKIMTKYP